MATRTAQILVGRAHRNHGGLLTAPLYSVDLTENSRAVWTLRTVHAHRRKGHVRVPLTSWIPEGPETVLVDGLTMIALHVFENPDVVAVTARTPLKAHRRLDLGRFEPSDLIPRLRVAAEIREEASDARWKLVISAYEGSTILGQLHAVERYSFDCEVLTPTFTRLSSEWTAEGGPAN